METRTMGKSDEEEFLNLSVVHESIERQMQERAWLIAPDDIKKLLWGDEGLFDDRRDLALKWLIEPHRELGEKSPAKVIIDGEADKVRDFLNKLLAGIFF